MTSLSVGSLEYANELIKPGTSKGTILVNDSTSFISLPSGADGSILKSNTGTSSGLEWDTIDAISTAYTHHSLWWIL